jgi:hypothetical protein
MGMFCQMKRVKFKGSHKSLEALSFRSSPTASSGASLISHFTKSPKSDSIARDKETSFVIRIHRWKARERKADLNYLSTIKKTFCSLQSRHIFQPLMSTEAFKFRSRLQHSIDLELIIKFILATLTDQLRSDYFWLRVFVALFEPTRARLKLRLENFFLLFSLLYTNQTEFSSSLSFSFSFFAALCTQQSIYLACIYDTRRTAPHTDE